MKALTGLPASAYLKVAEEAKIQLADLPQLVQQMEAGASPAYLARYRPDVSARLAEAQLRHVESRLREFLDLEDRRITVLTAIRQQNRMTPELQKKIEETTDRYELEDYYLAFKPKRRTPADDAVEQGLEPLAQFLWLQEPANADIEAVAQTYLRPETGPRCSGDALAGARHIIARWLGEDPEIRGALRPILREESEIAITAGDQPVREEAGQKKGQSLLGFHSKTGRVAWRQMMAIRRGVRERWLQQSTVLPENRAVEYMLGRLIRDPRSAFCLHLGAAACEAFHQYLAPSFANEVALSLDERCDNEAVQSFQKNLRKLLMAPPAGAVTLIGLETGRRGGWRAAVVGPGGDFLEGAIVYDPDAERSEEKSSAAPVAVGAAAAEEVTTGAAEATGLEAALRESPRQEPLRTNAVGESVSQAAEPAADSNANAVDSVAESPSGGTDSTASETTASEATASETTTAEATEAKAGAPASASPPQVAAQGGETPEAASPSHPESGDNSRQPGQPGQPGSAPRPGRDERIEVPKGSLSELIAKHKVAAIVIGNGPGVRQVEKFIRGEVRQAGAPDLFWIAIHEAGTWIHATSKGARREFAKVDPVMRSAISLARRLQDPMAELVKVDPKVLGVGQYHHEVDARKLRAGLRQTMEECVHQTGVDLNTAQLEQLALVPGVTERVAKRILDYRKAKGPLRRREQLREVAGLNERIYEQAVGFLRIYGGENPLDATGIHPSRYPVAEKILAAAGVSAAEALEKPEVVEAVNLEELQSEGHPLELLKAVAREFKPGVRQPRGTFAPPTPPVALRSIEDLKVGMKVEGIVTNLAKFGAFVDIGADQDGLVHVSQLSEKFIEDPQAAVKVGDRVTVHILALEQEGKRISLSMKEPREAPPRPRPGARRMAAATAGQRERDNGGPRRKRRRPERERGERSVARHSFGPDERAKAREQREAEKLSIDQKLALLENKFRTKVE
jgi:uncharacterized protein